MTFDSISPRAISTLNVLATTVCLVLVLVQERTRGAMLWCTGIGMIGLGMVVVLVDSPQDFESVPNLALSLVMLGGILKLHGLNEESPIKNLRPVLNASMCLVVVAYFLMGDPWAAVFTIAVQGMIWMSGGLLFDRLCRITGSKNARILAIVQFLGFGFMAVSILAYFADHSGLPVRNWTLPHRDPMMIVGVAMVAMQILYVGYQFELRAAAQVRLQSENETHEERIGIAMKLAPYGDFWRKDALSGYLVHEISQPVTAMLTNAQLAQAQLLSSPQSTEPVHESIEKLIRAGRHAKKVLEKIREQNRPRERVVTDESLRSIVADAVGLMEYECRLLHVGVSIQSSVGRDRVMVDRFELSQVVLNLLRNAIDAVSDTEKRRILIEISNTPDSVELSMTDSGAGFPGYVIENFGVPQNSRKENGTGLGLVIVKRIVEQCGGTVMLRAGVNGGACVQLNFPAAPEPALA